MFVALTDFVEPYKIPYINENQTAIENFIALAEKEVLKNLLGLSFYKKLEEAYTALPAEWSITKADYAVNDLVVYGIDVYKCLQIGTGKNPATEPDYWEVQPVNYWLLLFKGDVYTASTGIIYDWCGLQKLLLPAVFSKYLLEFSAGYQGNIGGRALPKEENAEVVSSAVKIADAWSVFSINALNGEVNCLYGFLLSQKVYFFTVIEERGYSSFQQYLDSNFVVESINEFDF